MLEQAAYLRRGIRKDLAARLDEMREAKEIVPIRVEGLENQYYFAFPNALNSLRVQSQTGQGPATGETEQRTLLSPFDNSVIQRGRLSALFDFQYQLECYVKPEARVRGYFCLPLLWRGAFVGVVDLKAERATRTLKVLALHWEKPRVPSPLKSALRQSLLAFAKFNSCDRVANSPS